MFEQCRLEKVSCPKFNTAVDLYRVTVRFSIISTLCRFITASYFIGGYRRSRIYSECTIERRGLPRSFLRGRGLSFSLRSPIVFSLRLTRISRKYRHDIYVY